MTEVNLTKAAAPKSDQLNADDLIGTSKTVRITKVSGSADDKQPISIYFEGDGGKPYKPCKSMLRVLIRIWGNVATAFIGRSMTLYRDDDVVFGGIKVGGIRISHMSNISEPITMSLTASRASRKPYTVKPLGMQQAHAQTAPATPVDDLNKLAAELAREIEMAESAAELGNIEIRCNELAAKLIEAKKIASHDKLLGMPEAKRGEFSSTNPFLG